MSMNAVIPDAVISASARSVARRSDCLSTRVMCRATRPIPVSAKYPVSSPVSGSRSMKPRGGSGVSFVSPAISSAFEFTPAPWNPSSYTSAGRSGTTASRNTLVSFPSGKAPSPYFSARIHSRSGLAAANERSESAIPS